jgi:hypothetical protein
MLSPVTWSKLDDRSIVEDIFRETRRIEAKFHKDQTDQKAHGKPLTDFGGNICMK